MLQRWCVILSIVGMLSGCGGKTYAPVSDRSVATAPSPSPSQYVVKKGDTLYSIAFRYGMDYRQLAAKNNIGTTYSIYPGQKLSLKAAAGKKAASNSIVRDSSISAPKPIITSSRDAVKASKPAPIVSKSKNVAQNSSSSNVNKSASSATQPKSKSKPTSVKSAVNNQTKSVGPIRWKWPVSGKVIGRFKTKGLVNKGINISGSKGKSISAAANGKVVYAGNGLLGYGNLVIVDHNQQFLSAYAHNSRVLVKENDMVKTGQKIAEMGSSGADRVMLHFEIRRDGKPVDPLKYLPKR